jgi:two-component system LytT family sensor kinase
MPSDFRTLLSRSALPWAAVAAVSVANLYVLRNTSGDRTPPHVWFVAFVLPYAAWWLATPLVAALCRRINFLSWRSIATHALLGVPFAVIPTALVVTALALLPIPWRWHGWWWEYRSLLMIRFGADFATYAAVVGILKIVDLLGARRDEIMRQARLESELAEVRVQAVVGQLHPHFLFNAMNSVAMLIRANENAAALKAVVGYSDILRTVLTARDTEVRLSDELELVRKYLSIEEMRWPDSVELSVDAAPGTEIAMVPQLILQPLVENALKHGLAGVPTGAAIRISAARDNGQLILAVQDNGVGMPADGWTEGVGLRSTRERIRLRHGDAAGMEIEPGAGGGTIVRLRLPFRPTSAAAMS